MTVARPKFKYAGIGSRETPDDVIEKMIVLGEAFAKYGSTLRSGGAEGADRAFILGADIGVSTDFGMTSSIELYLPWAGYNNWQPTLGRMIYSEPSPEAFEIAAKYHPAWSYLKQGAKKLHARNAHILLGYDLDDPVDEIICWTKGAKIAGGTGQALRMAPDWDISVTNLADPEVRDIIEDMLAVT